MTTILALVGACVLSIVAAWLLVARGMEQIDRAIMEAFMDDEITGGDM